MTQFIIAYYMSLVKVQANYCNRNILILDVKQLNKIVKLYYFHTLKALWDGQGKIKMYYEVSRVKKQLSGKKIYSYRFSYKFASIFFLPFLTNQKQESGFQEVGGLVTRNIYLFGLHRVALYFKVMPNSIDFICEFPHMLFQFVSL